MKMNINTAMKRQKSSRMKSVRSIVKEDTKVFLKEISEKIDVKNVIYKFKMILETIRTYCKIKDIQNIDP